MGLCLNYDHEENEGRRIKLISLDGKINISNEKNKCKIDNEYHLEKMRSLDKIDLEKKSDMEKLKFEREIKKIEINHEMDMKKIIISPTNNQIKENITNIIMSQDIIEGFWNENEETKK